jgi:hypothetical protein
MQQAINQFLYSMKTTATMILAALFLLTACQKEASIRTDTVKGVMTAGQNLSSADLKGILIYLGRFKIGVDMKKDTISSATVDMVQIEALDPNGAFSFSELTPGNYFLGLDGGYAFISDKVYKFMVDGKNEISIQQTINKIPDDNNMSIYMPDIEYIRVYTTNYTGPELKSIKYFFEFGGSVERDNSLFTKSTNCIISRITLNYFRFTQKLIFGFSDGKGGTIYSPKFTNQYLTIDKPTCPGLPCTVGRTTISYKPGSLAPYGTPKEAVYYLTDN